MRVLPKKQTFIRHLMTSFDDMSWHRLLFVHLLSALILMLFVSNVKISFGLAEIQYCTSHRIANTIFCKCSTSVPNLLLNLESDFITKLSQLIAQRISDLRVKWHTDELISYFIDWDQGCTTIFIVSMYKRLEISLDPVQFCLK